MKKQELITILAEKADTTKANAERIIDAYHETITETLAKGDDLQIVGFGTYNVKERAERQGRNPATGEQITIPASRVPGFKAGKNLKDAVNNR